MKTKDKRLVVVTGSNDVTFNLGGFSDDTFSWKGWLAVWNSVKHCPNLAAPLLDSGLEFDLDPQVTSDDEVVEALEFYFDLMTQQPPSRCGLGSDDHEQNYGAIALDRLIWKLCDLEFEQCVRSSDAGAKFIYDLCKTELCRIDCRVKFVHEGYLFHEEFSPLMQRDSVRRAAFLVGETIGFVNARILICEEMEKGDVRDIILSDDDVAQVIRSVRSLCALLHFNRFGFALGPKESVLFGHEKVCEYLCDELIPLYYTVDQRGSSLPQRLLRDLNDSRQLRDLPRIE